MDDFKVNHENNVKDVRSVKSSISKVANDLADNTLELRNEIKTVVNNAKQENEILQSTVIDLQCRSMKNNLVFTGLAETEGENTEEVIRVPDSINILEQEFLKFSANHESILLTGDFNSRTAANLDFYEITNTNHDTSDNFNIDFSNNLHKFNMSRIRNSCDKTKNHFGNLLLEMCRNNNLFILNGRVDGDKEGLFTCRQSSVVDYFICTYNLLSCVVIIGKKLVTGEDKKLPVILYNLVTGSYNGNIAWCSNYHSIKAIVATGVLHNICEKKGTPLPNEDLINTEYEGNDEMYDNDDFVQDGEVFRSRLIRERF
ncbi:unnamed protein product [Mytilus coruscus]|uniref:Endonuclease/exonuclease/phosphatase domain-containing protein n=1 Tax=Mytilus coruscus TaxID=42192 RepID=A0A6J8AY28_MYTCO|nr:unnamed protein product [Mytilus coruscus]